MAAKLQDSNGNLTVAGKREAVDAVLRGISLLNNAKPRWFTKINSKELDMTSTSQCMLGQAFGGFYDGVQDIARQAIVSHLKKLDIKLVDDGYALDSNVEIDSAHYGFNSPGDLEQTAENQYYSIMTETWKAAITAAKKSDKSARAKKKAAATRRAASRKR